MMSFKNITTLKEPDLSFNAIVKIPNEIAKLKNLERLDISSNAIQELNNSVFRELKALQVLYLAHNKITVISAGFPNRQSSTWNGLLSLQELHLEDNKISHIGYHAFSGLPKLQKLLLYENSLTTLSKDIFYPDDFVASDGHPPHLKFSM